MGFILRDKRPFAVAGLWDSWRKPDGSELQTFTIITTAANELLKAVHERMPVILHREDYAKWLDPVLNDPAKLTALLAPYPAAEMETFDVSVLVNSPHNDIPDCVLPLGVTR